MRGGQCMNFGVTGVESASGGLRRVACSGEAVARWTVDECGGEWCGVWWGVAAEVCNEERTVARFELMVIYYLAFEVSYLFSRKDSGRCPQMRVCTQTRGRWG